MPPSGGASVAEAGFDISDLVDEPMERLGEEIDTSQYGIWVPGIPVLIEGWLDSVNCIEWLKSLILDGIVGGVGSVPAGNKCGCHDSHAAVTLIFNGARRHNPGDSAACSDPTVSNVMRSMWERGWSFIKKAGTIILLSSVQPH